MICKKNNNLLKKKTLIKELIKFDFLILEQKNCQIKNYKQVEFYSKINNRKFIFSLEPKHTTYQLKQFSRNIVFSKNSLKGIFNIILNNKDLIFFFKKLLKNKKNTFLTNTNNFAKVSNLEQIQSLF